MILMPERVEQMTATQIFVGYCERDDDNNPLVCKSFMQQRSNLTVSEQATYDAFWTLINTKIGEQP